MPTITNLALISFTPWEIDSSKPFFLGKADTEAAYKKDNASGQNLLAGLIICIYTVQS